MDGSGYFAFLQLQMNNIEDSSTFLEVQKENNERASNKSEQNSDNKNN